jgi:hypothetical protein
MFLQLHLMMEGNGKDLSLSQMCELLYEQHGLELTKQSLDERFNTFAVSFMRRCFEHVFAQVLDFKPASVNHSCFKRVLLSDSTSYQLPAHLSHFYQGNGGHTSPASIKLHQQYDLLTGKVLRLDISDGKSNDALFLNQHELGDHQQELHLMDLGYFKLDHLQAIDKAGSFFISRYKVSTGVYVKDEQAGFRAADWAELLDQWHRTGQLPDLYLGKQKLKVRCIVEQLPEEVAAKRRKQYHHQQSKQSKKALYRWQVSERKQLLSSYNIYITNTSVEQLSKDQVGLYYKLRWQIELLFKIWKSVMEIDKVGKMSIFRFECYLYSRLLAILLSTHMHSLLKQRLEDNDELELSQWKTMKYLKKNSQAL